MATIMRKMNIISRCESIYRCENSSESLPGIYHSYTLAICKNPGMPQEALAKHLCLHKSNVTRHLAFLEKNGYIYKTACKEDKREHLVFPTEKMKTSLNEVKEITKTWNGLLTEGVSREELEIFHSILNKMLEKSIEITYKGGEGK